MPYYLDTDAGSDLNVLQDFRPTGGQAFGAQFGAAFEQNPTVLGLDALRVAGANRSGERLSAYDAGKIATEAGLRDFAPGEGEYTREALDMVIERKREQRQREDVIGRTPWSFIGSPLRGLGMLGASLVDPLNIGAAFVPVVREARYTALLRAASGGIERAAVRAGVGAVEGTVGMAALEPFIYGAHQYLDDDYTMRDSLLNIAFGGLLGGGLHVVGGRVADALMPGRWDRVASAEDAHKQSDLPGVRTDRGEPAPGSAADIAASLTPEGRADALRVAVGNMAEGKVPQVEPVIGYHGTRAQFIEFGVTNDFGYHFAAEPHISEGFALRGEGTEGRVISALLDIRNALDLPDLAGWFPTKVADAMVEAGAAPADFSARVWAAMERARIEHLDALPPELQALRGGPSNDPRLKEATKQAIEASNAAGNQAIREQLEAGGYDAVRYKNTFDSVKAADSYIVWKNEQIKQLGSGEPMTPEALRAVATRQASPESSITGDFAAAKAADERLAAAPKSDDVAAAQAMADAAGERAAQARAALEASGASDATLKRFDAAIAEADKFVADAESLGRAVEAAASCAAREV